MVNRHRLVALVTLVLLAMGYHASYVEAQVNQSVLAQQILGDDLEASFRALQTAQVIGPEDTGQELRAALVEKLSRLGGLQAQRNAAALSGEELEIPEGEDIRLIFDIVLIVAAWRDPGAIPALAVSLGNTLVANEALAEFGEEAVPAILDVVTSWDSRRGLVNGGLETLRFMVEGAATTPLSADALDQIRRAAEQRLTTGTDPIGQGGLLRRTIDLAIALDDPGLRRIVETLATDPDAVIARGVAEPERVERTQQYALDRLAGVQPPAQRIGLDAALERSR